MIALLDQVLDCLIICCEKKTAKATICDIVTLYIQPLETYADAKSPSRGGGGGGGFLVINVFSRGSYTDLPREAGSNCFLRGLGTISAREELHVYQFFKDTYEGCSNMNASSFITFFTYMLRQNGKRFYKGLYVTFKLAPDL